MSTVQIKTVDLIGPYLDWVVAQCEGVVLFPALQKHGFLEVHFMQPDGGQVYSPSTDWAIGGPIIEREGICVCITRKEVRGRSGLRCLIISIQICRSIRMDQRH